jgi:RNA polymerase-binding transcription factor DksA
MALTKEQLEELRAKLDATLVDIKSELGEIADEKGEVKNPEFGSDVESTEDLPEEADEAEEFATNIAIASGLKSRLEDIEHALRKINKNEYGKCEKCGMDIDYETLQAVPESRLCRHCKAGK